MLSPGTLIQNRYQILQRLGGGGMGVVYLAADLRLGNRRVVVKENRGGDARQFQIEANLLANLSHPNLPRVTDHFIETTGAQYLVMDYVEGQNLDAMVQQRGALPEATALAWMRQIFDAVEYLHANRIIHRDIKPQNIIITPQGKAMLVDFGIAKVMASGQSTSTGARAGSPGFAPPEQYTGGTNERSDVYSLGATLYYLLTGRVPPESPNRLANAVLIPPRQINAAISPNTEAVVVTAMDLFANQRYASIGAMKQALLKAPAPAAAIPRQQPAHGAPMTVTVPPMPQVVTWRQVNQWLVGLGVLGGIVVGWFLVWLLLGLLKPPTVSTSAMATSTHTLRPTFTPVPEPTDTPVPTTTPTATPTPVPSTKTATRIVRTATPQPPTKTPSPTETPSLTPFPFAFRFVNMTCEHSGGTYIKVFIDARNYSGRFGVRASYSPDGPPLGDRDEYGYEVQFTLAAIGPRLGTWYVWIIDDKGKRISDLSPAIVTNDFDDGVQGTCWFARVNFGSVR